MSESRLRDRFLDCKGMSIAEAEAFASEFAQFQRDIMWWIADLARYAEAQWPDTHHQVWPEWVSPGMLARAAGVGKAYPREEDRKADATYSIYMQNANRPDRIQRVAAHVEAGRTTDEARKADQTERAQDTRPRWILVTDVHYHLHRHWFSGAGVEAAVRVTEWVDRTVARLKEKGLTDVACAFEGRGSFRKELTAEWEDKYKDRPPKDAELVNQLQLVRELLDAKGFACVFQDGFEADDVMASFAAQFPGKVTLMSGDKDVRQCLSDRCNILLDVEWTQDPTSGDMLPEYKWLSAKQHTEATGLRPEQWVCFQTIMGDTVDGIKGAQNIGETGAKTLIVTFGSADAAIQAAHDEDERLLNMKRGKIMAKGLLEFEPKAAITRQLVALQTDLPIPQNTRI